MTPSTKQSTCPPPVITANWPRNFGDPLAIFFRSLEERTVLNLQSYRTQSLAEDDVKCLNLLTLQTQTLSSERAREVTPTLKSRQENGTCAPRLGKNASSCRSHDSHLLRSLLVMRERPKGAGRSPQPGGGSVLRQKFTTLRSRQSTSMSGRRRPPPAAAIEAPYSLSD
jgi:hypothetical protein